MMARRTSVENALVWTGRLRQLEINLDTMVMAMKTERTEPQVLSAIMGKVAQGIALTHKMNEEEVHSAMRIALSMGKVRALAGNSRLQELGGHLGQMVETTQMNKMGPDLAYLVMGKVARAIAITHDMDDPEIQSAIKMVLFKGRATL